MLKLALINARTGNGLISLYLQSELINMHSINMITNRIYKSYALSYVRMRNFQLKILVKSQANYEFDAFKTQGLVEDLSISSTVSLKLDYQTPVLKHHQT